MQSRWVTAVMVVITAGVARAQDVPEDSDVPADPAAMAAPPKELVPSDRPDIPSAPPDSFAVMAFENHSQSKTLDWLSSAGALVLGEKVEQVIGLDPAYDAWVVPAGPVIDATPANVAAFGVKNGVRWVFTGWVERPNWQLRLVTVLWRIDGSGATQMGQADRTADFVDSTKMIGDEITELVRDAGFAVSADQTQALEAPVTRDLYSLTLIGRGVGFERGTFGKVDLKQAEHDLTRATFIEPTMALGNRLVGQLWLDHPPASPNGKPDPKALAHNFDRAAGKFAYAVDLQPGYIPALRAAAAGARQEGKQDIARDLYDRIVRARPWDVAARIFLAEAMFQTGDGDGALLELERVVKVAPDDLRARRLVALIHAEKGDLAALATALEEIARRAPDDMDVRLDLGATYSALGRWDDARAVYAVVAAARPDDANVLKLAGDVERHRGDPGAATAWYARMEKAAPDDPRPPFLIGETWYDAGDLAKAQKAFIRTQTFKDEEGYALTALGIVHWKSGEADNALWYLRRAARAMPHTASARVALAWILLVKKNGSEAITQIEAARELGGEGAELDYLAAIAHALTGDLDGAKASAKAAAQAGLAEAARAASALDRGSVPDVEGMPKLDVPFGDVVSYERAIDAFFAAEGEMSNVRKGLDQQMLTALARLGEGPDKDLSKTARAKPWVHVCPVAAVATPYIAAKKLARELVRRGLVLEDAYRRVAILDSLGETGGLTPDYRKKVAEVKATWRRSLVGVREVRSELEVGLGRELAARRCKDSLLYAAAAHPELYGGTAVPAARLAGPPSPVVAPTITMYVDNRECTEPLGVWVDGVSLGTAPSGARAAFQAPSGSRTLCLLQAGDAACGDRGTVRDAYLYDGWSTLVHCRGGTFQEPAALPGPSADPELDPDQ